MTGLGKQAVLPIALNLGGTNFFGTTVAVGNGATIVSTKEEEKILQQDLLRVPTDGKPFSLPLQEA